LLSAAAPRTPSAHTSSRRPLLTRVSRVRSAASLWSRLISLSDAGEEDEVAAERSPRLLPDPLMGIVRRINVGTKQCLLLRMRQANRSESCSDILI
uniref:Uncharacterized protein n=1 Tax=Aegilops tauschii subsp. strangulata TaxID=200361 RepID=A0A453PGL9_AEGTS